MTQYFSCFPTILRLIFFIALTITSKGLSASTLTKDAVVNGTVKISWTCTGTYCVLQCSVNNATPQTITTSNSSGSYNASVTVGNTYSFILKTYTAGGASGPVHTETDNVVVTPTATPPTPPTPPTPSSLTVPGSDIDGHFPVTWPSVSGATFYVLDSSVVGGGWTEVYRGAERIYPASLIPGSYLFRVKACVDSSVCSAYKTSNTVSISGSLLKTTRRVVFVHTDLLGSPAAETNEQGNENE